MHFAFDEVSFIPVIEKDRQVIRLGSNVAKFVLNLIVLGVATILPFILSFGPFVLMVRIKLYDELN